MKVQAILAFMMAFMTTASAFAGAESGGGGDSLEIRVDAIRADVLKWIGDGGAKNLKLPSGMSYQTYVSLMTSALMPRAVVVSFVNSSQESSTVNPELKVIVRGQPKTCRGFVSREDQLPHILCNVERFGATSQADQYRLIHHEFAGLAGVEQNVGAASDYEISNQLTEFLVPETILRLSVKSAVREELPTAGGALRSLLGKTELSVQNREGCSLLIESNEIWMNDRFGNTVNFVNLYYLNPGNIEIKKGRIAFKSYGSHWLDRAKFEIKRDKNGHYHVMGSTTAHGGAHIFPYHTKISCIFDTL